jgi:hypothetical protein
MRDRELIVPEERSAISGDRAFRFRHGLICEVAYATVTKSEGPSLIAASRSGRANGPPTTPQTLAAVATEMTIVRDQARAAGDRPWKDAR